MNLLKSMAVVSVATVGIFVASAVQAGEGCMYQYSAEMKEIKKSEPVMANAGDKVQNPADPKWLAMLKRRELEAKKQGPAEIVHN